VRDTHIAAMPPISTSFLGKTGLARLAAPAVGVPSRTVTCMAKKKGAFFVFSFFVRACVATHGAKSRASARLGRRWRRTPALPPWMRSLEFVLLF
jgi:hypothetical protein